MQGLFPIQMSLKVRTLLDRGDLVVLEKMTRDYAYKRVRSILVTINLKP